jgi:D-glycero-D-manno-heptose 1,7-bisphosphate phosphatase
MGRTETVGSDHVWCEILRPRAVARLRGRPALFLDRDGVLVEEVGYLHRPADVRLNPGTARAVALANQRGLAVVVVTNQAGVGRGLYGWPDFAATQARIQSELAATGAVLDMVLACPFHRDARPPYRHPDHPDRKPRPGMLRRADDHPDRKPRPGMLRRADQALGLDLGGSWIVGDRAGDLAAGRAAGLAGGLHLDSGQGEAERAEALELAGPDFAVRLLASAEELITAPLLENIQAPRG